jgi:glycosyltransferase involved in cell wall biosynthesis
MNPEPVPVPGVVLTPGESTPRLRSLVIWHSEGTAVSGLLSWMWRLKRSLPAAGVDLTLASLELQPFRFTQVCAPEAFYDVRVRHAREWAAFLKEHQSAIHIINHAYEYVDLLEQLRPELLERLTLVGICHTDQDYYYHHLCRLDARLAGIIAVSPVCAEKLGEMLPHRRGSIPVLPDWDMPVMVEPAARGQDSAQPLRLLFNGRLLHLQKRVLDLPEISRRLAEAGVPAHLTIVGDGPDLPKLRDAFSRGRHIPHRLLGPRAPWEMTPLLATHDIFLQVSEFEGASVSLMEAMVAGLVPVVTGTASGTELLESNRNALISPVGDTAAIAARIAELATDRARLPQLANAAYQDARTYLHALNYPARLRSYLAQLTTAPRAATVC